MREINAQMTAKTVHMISDIKRVERARKRVHNQAIGEKTIKNVASGLMTLALLLTGVKNVSAEYVLVEPPRYQANLLTDFMITKIVPSTGVIEATERLLPGHDYHNIYHINLAFGSDPSDYELSQLAYDNRAGDITIFNKNAIYGGIWIDGQAEDISKDYRTRGGVISQNDTGRMYFIAVYSDFKMDFGRVDYSRCIKSSVFISGEATECRAEATKEGRIQYQPYTADGVRVEIPEAEDIELSALTDRFIYESGDWPAEYEWVEDEPEPGNNGSNGENLDTNTEVATVDSDVNSATVNTDASSGVDVGMGVAADIDANANTDTNTNANAKVNADADTGTNNTDTTTSTGSILNANTVSQPENGILGTEPVTVEIQIVDGDGDTTGGVNKDLNLESPAVTTESGQDDVGVPELGKESGNQKWVALPLMLAGATAAIVGWWFLFFGKKKSKKERKEEK